MWYVYVIINTGNGFHYTGMTSSLERRFAEHNRGRNKSTRHHRPFDKIIKIAEFEDRMDARASERYYKSGIGREKLKMILSGYSSVG